MEALVCDVRGDIHSDNPTSTCKIQLARLQKLRPPERELCANTVLFSG